MNSSPGTEALKHPVDRGWAWLICLGAFGINFFVNGGLRSTGIIFIELVIRYQADQSLTSLTVAAMASGFAIFSAVGSAVGALKTMRVACLIGAVLMFLGMFFTYFAQNIYAAIVCLGLMSGIGYGFAFTQSMVVVGQYFVRRRSLAVGLAAAGGSVGTLILPLYIRAATQEYGFQGMILIYSGIVLHAIPSAMLLRPVSFYYPQRPVVQQPAKKDGKNEKETVEDQNKEKGGTEEVGGNSQNGKGKGSVETGSVNSHDEHYELVGSRVIVVPIGGSVENIPMQADDEDDDETGSPPAPPAPHPPKMTVGLFIRMFCRKICDRELFCHLPFLFYALGLTLGHGGFISNCLYIPPFAFEFWHSKKLAATLIVILGIADLVGRIGGGWFADLGFIRKPFIIGFSFAGAGIATIVFPFFPYFVPMVIYVIVLGLLGGMYLAQMFVVATDLVGAAKSPSALGLATLGMGLVLIPLLPVLSSIAVATGTFGTALRISGVLLLLGGILFYFVPLTQKFQARKESAKLKKKSARELEEF